MQHRHPYRCDYVNLDRSSGNNDSHNHEHDSDHDHNQNLNYRCGSDVLSKSECTK